MTTFNFDMRRIGQTIARLKAGKNIGDLLPFLNQDMLLKLFSAASTNN